jgi:hypothetical protein
MEPLFMLPSVQSNFCGKHVGFEVSMEVSVPEIPRCINYVPEYFILKSLYGYCGSEMLKVVE